MHLSIGVGGIFSSGEPVGDFPKIFSRGGPKVVKFVFHPSKLKKQPFFANTFKIQGGQAPPALPFRRPCIYLSYNMQIIEVNFARIR